MYVPARKGRARFSRAHTDDAQIGTPIVESAIEDSKRAAIPVVGPSQPGKGPAPAQASQDAFIAGLQKKIADLEQALARVTAQSANLAEQLRNATTQIEALQAAAVKDAKDKDEEIRATAAQIEALQAAAAKDTDELRRAIAQKDNTIETLTETVSQYKATIDSLTSQPREQTTPDIETSRDAIAQKDKSIQSLMGAVESYKETIASLEAQLNTERETANALRVAGVTKQELEGMENIVRSTQQLNEAPRGALDSKTSFSESQAQTIVSLKTEIERRGAEMTSLQEKYEAQIEDERAAHQSAIVQLQKQHVGASDETPRPLYSGVRIVQGGDPLWRYSRDCYTLSDFLISRKSAAPLETMEDVDRQNRLHVTDALEHLEILIRDASFGSYHRINGPPTTSDDMKGFLEEWRLRLMRLVPTARTCNVDGDIATHIPIDENSLFRIWNEKALIERIATSKHTDTLFEIVDAMRCSYGTLSWVDFRHSFFEDFVEGIQRLYDKHLWNTGMMRCRMLRNDLHIKFSEFDAYIRLNFWLSHLLCRIDQIVRSAYPSYQRLKTGEYRIEDSLLPISFMISATGLTVNPSRISSSAESLHIGNPPEDLASSNRHRMLQPARSHAEAFYILRRLATMDHGEPLDVPLDDALEATYQTLLQLHPFTTAIARLEIIHALYYRSDGHTSTLHRLFLLEREILAEGRPVRKTDIRASADNAIE